MRLLILLAGALLLQGKCEAQNTTTEPEEGSATTTEAQSTEAATEESNGTATERPECDIVCENNGTCVEESTGFACQCPVNYVGSRCQISSDGCPSVSFRVDNTIVNQDAKCGNSSTASSKNVTVEFGKAERGQTVLTNETCVNTCRDRDTVPRSLGFRQCLPNGLWADIEWVDCSLTDQDATVSDNLTSAIQNIADSNNIAEDDVAYVAQSIAASADEENIPEEEVEKILIATNILCGVENQAKDEVTKNSKSLLESINKLGENIDLTSSSSGLYQEEQPLLAFAAAEFTTTRDLDKIRMARVDETENVTYVLSIDWDSEYGFDSSSFELTTERIPDNAGSSVMAKPSDSGGRISFAMFYNASAIFPSDDEEDSIVKNNLVLAGSGNSEAKFTFRFVVKPDVNLTEDNVSCMRWNRNNSKWDVASKCKKATDIDNAVVSCECTGPGEYKTRSVPSETTTDGVSTTGPNPTSENSGLSPGAIAGIVVGCVVALALIGGGVYYFHFHKKAAKTIRVSPVPNDDVELPDRA